MKSTLVTYEEDGQTYTVDLTRLTTPTGLLHHKVMNALLNNGGPYEVYTHIHEDGFNAQWKEVAGIQSDIFAHRVKSEPLTKPSIDWTIFAPEVQWLARDERGHLTVFKERPQQLARYWSASTGDFSVLSTGFIASLDPGTCDWRDSLVQRPEGV